MFDLVLDLLYPRTCDFCGRISKDYICSRCQRILLKNEKPKIYKSNSKLIKYHGYIFRYEGRVREKIIDYKFNEKAYLNKAFSKIIIKNENICRFIKKYDIILPVPIHKKRKQSRGYDQTELIAKNIADVLNVNIKTDILIKKNNIKPQSTLNKIQRKQNVRGAYEIKNYTEIENKKVLIVDDIYTTGLTVEECAKTLKIAKPKEISVFTFAKD